MESKRKLTFYLEKRKEENNILKENNIQNEIPRRVINLPVNTNKKTEVKDKCTGKVSNYIIGPQIGKGAYAEVREGINKILRKRIAIKIYEKSKLVSTQRRNIVMNEIQILKKLKHPHIVEFYETIQVPNKLLLIMEFIKGKSLYDYVKSKPHRRLSETEAIIIFKQILEGINYCHNNMISHRDIKPDNILVDNDGYVKIIDFGFSVLSGRSQKLKLFCGTPSYMSPEVVMQKEYIGTNYDIWSLGILFYFMLSGTVPFHGRTDYELYANIICGQVDFPPYFSTESKEFIMKMLQVDPYRRTTAINVSL